MRKRIYFNDHWMFTEQFQPEITADLCSGIQMEEVRIPHTFRELPYDYFDEELYQLNAGYRKCFYADPDWKNKSVILHFEGSAHVTEVYLNGEKVAEHFCGYTAFSVELNTFLRWEKENVLAVRVDSRETLNIPPFGHVVDYMTYGGIYRDVCLEICEPIHMEDLFLKPKVSFDDKGERIWLETVFNISEGVNPASTKDDDRTLRVCQSYRRVGESEYRTIGEQPIRAERIKMSFALKEIQLWSPETPVLYEIRTQIISGTEIVDEIVKKMGFRKAEFCADGFYLNQKKYKIFGLNRHQSFPYVGYAMPKSMQRLDAEILKWELGLNAVRTSHYPQSHDFLDRCDELGLLVFTEIPGWQHIGDDAWKKQAVQNVKDMVRQYRNHTSIILWGVRINESKDDDAFYQKTNRAARELDDTRQTGGVRAITKSHLYEDVYTYNDFVHAGDNPGCLKKKKVTSDPTKAYMVTEYNGHMFPTKAFDCGRIRTEHAIRHARVIQAVRKEDDIAGSFGWCFADYNTHKDFGSGDRICYHGVMDMFRNSKLAAKVYASQQEETPILEITTSFDVGEQPESTLGNAWIITNADEVRMYKNDRMIKVYKKEDSPFDAMKHGPILLDDYVGNLLDDEKDLSSGQKRAIRKGLNLIARYGMNHLPKRAYLTALKIIGWYRISPERLTKLYETYIGNWGGEASVYQFEAIQNGRLVKEIEKSTMKQVYLEVVTSHHELVEEKSYDVAAVRIRAVDEHGNLLPFYQQPVRLEVEGPLELIGPDVIALQGGMGGTYLRTKGIEGSARLKLKAAQTDVYTECFEIIIKGGLQ